MSGQFFLLAILVVVAFAVIFFPREIRRLFCRYLAYRYLDPRQRTNFFRVTDAELLRGIERRVAELSSACAKISSRFDNHMPQGADLILRKGGQTLVEFIDACKTQQSVEWCNRKVNVVCDEAERVSNIVALSWETRENVREWGTCARVWAQVCYVLVPYLVERGVLAKTSTVYKSWGQQ